MALGRPPGLISGQWGERLPGSPKSSAAATMSYEHALAAQYSMVLSANVTYTGSVLNGLPAPNNPQVPLPGYTLGNLSLAVEHRPYALTGYVTNIADKRAVLGFQPYATPPTVGALANYDVINRPREIGLRVRYSF